MLADDALAAVRVLRRQTGVDQDRVGLWGLSEGGWVVPLAASRSSDVDFVVTVAANSIRPIDQEQWNIHNKLLHHGVRGSLVGAYSETLTRLAAGSGLFAEAFHDPLPVLAKVRQPVLGLWGEYDRLTPPAESLTTVPAGLRGVRQPALHAADPAGGAACPATHTGPGGSPGLTSSGPRRNLNRRRLGGRPGRRAAGTQCGPSATGPSEAGPAGTSRVVRVRMGPSGRAGTVPCVVRRLPDGCRGAANPRNTPPPDASQRSAVGRVRRARCDGSARLLPRAGGDGDHLGRSAARWAPTPLAAAPAARRDRGGSLLATAYAWWRRRRDVGGGERVRLGLLVAGGTAFCLGRSTGASWCPDEAPDAPFRSTAALQSIPCLRIARTSQPQRRTSRRA